MLHPAPIPADEFSATQDSLATKAEVLLIALRLVGVLPDDRLDRWQAAVLLYDDEEALQGAAWRPPWPATLFVRKDIMQVLTQKLGSVAACVIVLTTWSGAGVVEGNLGAAAVAKFFRNAQAGVLRCPKTDPKSPGPLRPAQAAVRVARLVRERRADLAAAWDKAYVIDAPRPITKREIIIDLQEQLEAKEVDLQEQLEAKEAAMLEQLDALTRWRTRRRSMT